MIIFGGGGGNIICSSDFLRVALTPGDSCVECSRIGGVLSWAAKVEEWTAAQEEVAIKLLKEVLVVMAGNRGRTAPRLRTFLGG